MGKMKEYFADQLESDPYDDPELCSFCAGSGEDMHDGSICGFCNGTGVHLGNGFDEGYWEEDGDD